MEDMLKSDLPARLAASLTTRPPHLPTPHLPLSSFFLQQNPTLPIHNVTPTLKPHHLSLSFCLSHPPNSNPNPCPWPPPPTRSLFPSPPNQPPPHLFVKSTTTPIHFSAFRILLTRSRSAPPSFPRLRLS